MDLRREPATVRLLLIQALFACFVAVGVGIVADSVSPYGTLTPPDFGVFWGAQRVANPYSSAALESVLGNGLNLFPYPPTFLVLTRPLAWASQHNAYLAWLGFSAAALVVSIRHAAGPLVLLSPAVFMAGLVAQTSMLMGALLFAAATLFHRPILAGVLLGLATCIKPQVTLLIPLVLIGSGQWRILASVAVTGIVLCVAATGLYGPEIWMTWLRSLPGFLQTNDALLSGRYLALEGPWKTAPIILGAILAWWSGRKGRYETGVFVAIAAAFLGSVHAIDYDAAILAPFAVSAALAAGWRGLGCAAAMLCPPSGWSVAALGGLASLIAIDRPKGDRPIDFKQLLRRRSALRA